MADELRGEVLDFKKTLFELVGAIEVLGASVTKCGRSAKRGIKRCQVCGRRRRRRRHGWLRLTVAERTREFVGKFALDAEPKRGGGLQRTKPGGAGADAGIGRSGGSVRKVDCIKHPVRDGAGGKGFDLDRGGVGVETALEFKGGGHLSGARAALFHPAKPAVITENRMRNVAPLGWGKMPEFAQRTAQDGVGRVVGSYLINDERGALEEGGHGK